MSVHTESFNSDILEGTRTHAAPIWGGLTQSQRVSILELYLHEIISGVANVEASVGSAAQLRRWDAHTFARALLESRYAHLHADEAVDGLDEAIAAARVGFLETTFRLPPPSQQMTKMIQERARHFLAWRQTRITVDVGAWDIVLGDFVEDVARHERSPFVCFRRPFALAVSAHFCDVASTVVGPLSVAAFLELLAGDIVLLDADDDRAAAAMQSDVYLWNGAIGAPLPSASGGNTPERGDVVRIHYDAWLADAQDGAPFDSSRSAVGADGVGVPFEFEVGTARVIAGLERTVRRMRAGDACRVFVPSALAYGSAGSGGGVVPPYADLVFAVELISVTPSEPAIGAGRVETAAPMSL